MGINRQESVAGTQVKSDKGLNSVNGSEIRRDSYARGTEVRIRKSL